MLVNLEELIEELALLYPDSLHEIFTVEDIAKRKGQLEVLGFIAMKIDKLTQKKGKL